MGGNRTNETAERDNKIFVQVYCSWFFRVYDILQITTFNYIAKLWKSQWVVRVWLRKALFWG
jgi:hypothetical protein